MYISEFSDDDMCNDDESIKNTIELMRCAQSTQFASAVGASKYFRKYYDKNDARTSAINPRPSNARILQPSAPPWLSQTRPPYRHL
jgi:hypothetical protein